jgi:hypothetical protein
MFTGFLVAGPRWVFLNLVPKLDHSLQRERLIDELHLAP